MRRFVSNWRLVVLFLGCCAVAVAGHSQPASATAISVPQAAPVEASVFANDARLLQKVRLRVEGLPVKELLALLAQRTGVDLRSQEDIGDEKVVIFQPARPLQATLLDLAALFNNRWERVELPGQPLRYRLLRTARAREYEDSLALAPARRYMAQMRDMVNALAETPDQLVQRPANDPVRACLLNPERRLATQFYAGLSEAQQLQLFEEGTADEIPFASLDAAQQEMLLQWREALAAKTQSPLAGAANGGLNGLSGISGNLSREELTQATLHFALSGGPARDTASVRLQVGSNGVLMLRTLYDRGTRALSTRADPYTGKAVAAVPGLLTIEALNKATRQAHWIDRLRLLSEASGLPILSDYFRTNYSNHTNLNKTASASPKATGSDAGAEMDRFCQSYQRLWWVRGQTLLLRGASWATLRDYEIPDRWTLDFCRRIHARNDTPTFGDMYGVLALTPKQVVGLDKMYELFDQNLNGPKQLNTRPLVELIRACLPDESQPLPPATYYQWGHHPAPITFANMPVSARAYLPAVLGHILPDLLAHPEQFQAGVYTMPGSLSIDDIGKDGLKEGPPELMVALRKQRDMERRYLAEKDAEQRRLMDPELKELYGESSRLLDKAYGTGDKRVLRTDMVHVLLFQRGARLTLTGSTASYAPCSHVLLPLQIPDNRRDKTEVELVSK